jgi:hypothetical protein
VRISLRGALVSTVTSAGAEERTAEEFYEEQQDLAGETKPGNEQRE